MTLAGEERWKDRVLLKSRSDLSVFTAWDQVEQSRVFLKCLDNFESHNDTAASLSEESALLKELQGGYFPEAVFFGAEGGTLVLAVSELRGESLSQILSSGPLGLNTALRISIEIGQALKDLHRHGVIHCDLKPEHIFIEDGLVRICDLGYAQKTRGSRIGFTPRYAAPEQMGLVKGEVQPSTDLYSLGLILVEMLTGNQSWPAQSKLSNRINSAWFLPFGLPSLVKPILERLLASDPRERYNSADGLIFDLKSLCSGPLVATGLRDRRTSPTSPSLVGREAEIEAFEEFLNDGQGVLWLASPSGRGKTRLLGEFEGRARERGMKCLLARGQVSVKSTYTTLWSSLVAQMTQILSKNPTLQEYLQQQMGADVALLRRVFPSLLGDINSPQEQVKPKAVVEALVTTLELICEKEPLLFLLDDLQWGDFLTLQWLLREAGPGALVVGTFRSEEISADHPLWNVRDEALHLRKLSRPLAAALLHSMLGDFPAEAKQAFLEKGEGEPFFLRALVFGACEMDLLTSTGSGWHWRPGPIQTNLETGLLLAYRFEMLTKDCQRFLMASSVLGREFSLEEAAYVSELSEEALGAARQECLEKHLVWVDGTRGEFSHDKIRETALAQAQTSDRVLLNRRAAAWLQEVQTKDYGRLAIHLAESNQLESALTYSRTAAEKAAAKLDFSSQITYLSLARNLARELAMDELTGDLCVALGKAQSRHSLFPQAITSFREALDYSRDDASRLHIISDLVFCYGRNTEHSETRELILEGLRSLGRKVPHQSRAGRYIEAGVSWTRFLIKSRVATSPQLSTFNHAGTRLFRAAAQTWSIGADGSFLLWAVAEGCLFSLNSDFPEAASLLASAGLLSVMLGRLPLAERLFRSATDLAAESPEILNEVLAQSGFLPIASGELDIALDIFERAYSLSYREGDVWNQGATLGFAGFLLYFKGEYVAAHEKARMVLRNPSQDETNFCAASLILALIGKNGATELLGPKHSERIGVTRIQNISEQALGLDALRSRNFNEACDHFQIASDVFDHSIFFVGAFAPAWLATSFRVRAEHRSREDHALRLRDLRLASRAAQKALRVARNWKVNQPHAFREYAISSAHAGRFYLARANFEKAFNLSEKMGMAFESAWTLYERGRFATVAGWDDWLADRAEGLARVRRLGGWIPGVDLSPPEPHRHLAKLDRFDRVLEGGRRLVALEGEDKVMQVLQDETRSLLRCDKVVLIRKGEPLGELSHTLYERCLSERRAVTEAEVDEPTRSLLLHEARSTLMAPLKVGDQPVAVLVAWQKTLGGFFGEEETRLADYLCTLAGAGLENARILKERDAAFSSLQVSEKRFRGFFEYAGVGTALLDEDGRTLEENPHLQVLLGGSTLDKVPWGYAHAEDRERLKRGFEKLRASPVDRFDAEIRMHRSGGEVAWTQSCIVRLPLHQRDRSRYLLTVADTTHRRITEMMAFLENERRGLAAEVHDELAQNLSALHLILAGLASDDPNLTQAKNLAKRLVRDSSNLIVSLRNPLAEGVDLSAALKALVTDFSIESEAELHVVWPDQSIQLSDMQALVVYRVLQEGLANIRKHSQAGKVSLTLDITSAQFTMTLADNGVGFEAEKWLQRKGVTQHFGLLSMRDRVEMVGGRFRLLSTEGDGVVLGVEMPLQAP